MGYWSFSGSSSSYSSKKKKGGGTSAWNTAGETCNLDHALARYGVTEQQVFDAKPPIEMQCRSCFGNLYRVVKIADIAALKARLDREEKEKKLQEEIEKAGGKEAYEAKKAKEEQERIERLVREEKEKKEEMEKQRIVNSNINTIHQMEKVFYCRDKPIGEDVTISKSKAKTTWGIKEAQFASLPSVQSGRYPKYKLDGVVAQAETNHGTALEKRLTDATDLAHYHFHVKEKLRKDLNVEECPLELMKQSVNKPCAELKQKVDSQLSEIQQLQSQLTAAKVELGKRKKRATDFQDFCQSFLPNVTIDDQNMVHKESVESAVASGSPPKKTKLDLMHLAKISREGNFGLDTDDEEATDDESDPSTPESDLQVRPVSTDEKKPASVTI